MNIASALLKQIIVQNDMNTWSNLKENYLPSEYQPVFGALQKHIDNYSALPDFESLKYEIRDRSIQEKIFAIEAVDVDVDAWLLLDYLKNEYAQIEILDELDKYVDSTVALASAEENLEQLQDIVLKVSDRVDVKPPEESMESISLFDSQEELGKYVQLGFNNDFDSRIQFSPKDLVMVGGKRGAGKSVTCCNIASTVYNKGKSALYFTIEMDARSILQRICSISTQVPFNNLRNRQLSPDQWKTVAGWWANRFEGGHELLPNFYSTGDFDTFHKDLTKLDLDKGQQIDVIYDPSLTLGKIQSELDKKVNQLDIGVVVVDYINQVKRSNAPSRGGQYEWTEQIEVSKRLKTFAQEYNTMFFAPYQTDATGEARFAKGILDAADAAFNLETWEKGSEVVTFFNTKMRNNEMLDFTSVVNWNTLTIGPQSGMNPKEREAMESSMKTGEDMYDD